jgi:hypothetical protein
VPVFDRFWWLLLITGLMLLAGAAGILIWQTVAVSGNALLAGTTPCWGAVTLLLAVVALGMLVSSLQARDRKIRRLAALAGNQNAVAPAR